MQEFVVAAVGEKINFGAGGVEEILQNVRMIVTTPKYSVPLDREFGINAAILDKPLPVARAGLAAAITDAVRRYEPRVAVTGIEFGGDGITGSLVPKVKVRLK
jgi:phage baseplate assembly protein W